MTSIVNSYDQHTWATPLSVIGLLASPVSSAASVILENVQQAVATHTYTHTVLLPLNPHGGRNTYSTALIVFLTLQFNTVCYHCRDAQRGGWLYSEMSYTLVSPRLTTASSVRSLICFDYDSKVPFKSSCQACLGTRLVRTL